MAKINLKLKALLQSEIGKGTLPRDAMDKVQQRTRKEYARDDLRNAADSAIEEVKRNGKKFWWMEFL